MGITNSKTGIFALTLRVHVSARENQKVDHGPSEGGLGKAIGKEERLGGSGAPSWPSFLPELRQRGVEDYLCIHTFTRQQNKAHRLTL